MKRRTFFLKSFFLIGLSFVLDQGALASDDLASREAAAAKLMSDANLLSQFSGRYKSVRDHYVVGEGGLQKSVQTWLKDVDFWMDIWFKVLAYGDLAGSDVNLSAIQSNIEPLLKEQEILLVLLVEESHKIREMSDIALGILQKALPIAPDTLPQNRDIVDRAIERTNDLKQSITILGATPDKRIRELAKLAEPGRDGVIAKLRANLLTIGRADLVTQLDRVGLILKAEMIIDPYLTKLESDERKMSKQFIFLQVFAMQETLLQSRHDCSRTKDAIESVKTELPPSLIKASQDRSDILCRTIENYQQQMTELNMSLSEIVKAQSSQFAEFFATRCKSNAPFPYCEKVALLASIKPEEFSHMDDNRLKFVENSWRNIQDQQ